MEPPYHKYWSTPSCQERNSSRIDGAIACPAILSNLVDMGQTISFLVFKCVYSTYINIYRHTGF